MNLRRFRSTSLAHCWRRLYALSLVLAFVGFCVMPYFGWARYPSLFDDDFTRVGSLRRSTPASSLFRPFNEHLAPLFELVSWITWWGVGERVERVATGFLVASYLSTFATLATLLVVVRLEVGSTLAALVAGSLFCVTTVSAETVLWYSASSFQWAAATSLAAWFAATMVIRSSVKSAQVGWLVGSACFALASPLFSAIGALAGPLATLRLILAQVPPTKFGSTRSRWLISVVPVLGTLAYAALVVAHRSHSASVSQSVRDHLDLQATLWATLRAPSLVLLPAMGGLSSRSGLWSDWGAACATVGLAVVVLAWGFHSRSHRGLIFTGLGWVIGGYLLAYSARAQPGDVWIFEVGRYHLYPQVGLICWVSTLLGPLLDQLEVRKPTAGLSGVVVIAALGFVLKSPAMSEVAYRSFRYPDQGRAVAAALRLEAICRSEQVPLEQAIRVIDPVEPRWFPRPLPFHPLLYLFGSSPTVERWNDPEARSRVLRLLSIDDREAIFGGIKVSGSPKVEASRESELAWLSIEATGQGVESIVGEGSLFFQEFAVPQGREVEVISLSGGMAGTKLEVWWSSSEGRWSSDRSIRLLGVGPGQSNIICASLPHWRVGFARRIRIIRRGRPSPSSEHPAVACLTRPA